MNPMNVRVQGGNLESIKSNLFYLQQILLLYEILHVLLSVFLLFGSVSTMKQAWQYLLYLLVLNLYLENKFKGKKKQI